MWSLAKEAEGDHVGEWKHIYYQAAATNINKMLQDYQDSSTQGTPETPPIGQQSKEIRQAP